jgi:2-polyprenyl-3-methyl-5-hydroxy-6-metoxy-1,4-benzoquinol methylase
MKKFIYRREIFSVKNLQDAKHVILTPEEDATVDQRWERETPVMAEILGQAFALDNNNTVLDYGCGIGRISKALIDNYGCSVVGVDISTEMHQFAIEYVNSDRFSICYPDTLEAKSKEGFKADYAISIYVLQHTLRPALEIAKIRNALKTGGKLLVLNNNQRCVPTNEGWVNDGKDVRMMLCNQLREIVNIQLPSAVFGEALINRTFCRIYEKTE